MSGLSHWPSDSDPATLAAAPSRRETFPLFGAAMLGGIAPSMMAAAPASAEDEKRGGRPPRGRKRFVYVGTYTTGSSESRGIYVYRMDDEGGLSLVQTVSGIRNPSWLTLHPQQHVLYATSEVSSWEGRSGGGVSAYAVDAATGKLTKMNDRHAAGMPVHSSVDSGGQYLLTANYVGANFAVLTLRTNGSLDAVTDVAAVAGRGPHPQRQAEPHPHQVIFDPAYGHVLGVDLGTDRLWTWGLDAASATLEPNQLPFSQVASGSGARHAVFHPTGRFVYVINELTSSLTAYEYDRDRGTCTWLQTLSTLPPGFTGENFPAEIAVHPSGRFLYGSNRGHDSIVSYRIDERTGQLKVLGWEPTQGQWPRNFAIEPSGNLLLAANQNSNDIVAFHIHGGTGQLHPTKAATSVPSPACVTFGGLADPTAA